MQLIDFRVQICYNNLSEVRKMAYSHRVQYYETDKMQCTHHSNYVRFMEESRLDFLDKLGYGYARMEAEGLISPVIAIDLQFKHTTTFNDVIDIEVKLASMTNVKLEFEYVMTCGDKVVCLAHSTHCYVDEKGRPISLKKVRPELYELLCSHIAQN